MSENNEKSTQAGSGQNVQCVNDSRNSIAQDALINQGNPVRKRKEKRLLGLHSKVYSLAVKCYAEQLPHGEDCLINAIKGTDKKYVQILAIRHDRDIVTDGIWRVATEKPHWHIVLRMADRHKTLVIKTIFKGLGIWFRPGIDDALWLNRGVETVGNFAGYATYLTHDTDDAIADAKERYDITEIISNLTVSEIEQVRAGYVRVSEKLKISQDELVSLDKEAFELGYKMGNFTTWYNAQPFAVRANAKMRVIRESYDRGVESRIQEGREINRLCIFIAGESNTGKTYAAKKALEGKEVLSIGGGGTGKFDRLRADHDAIIIDDDVCPNLLNMTDNYICHAYRRNKDNPAWAGEYFIVTSNLRFETWLELCGIKCRDFYKQPTEHYKAMLSRFFVCHLKSEGGTNRLVCTSASTRGGMDAQTDRKQKFVEFRQSFDEIIAGYKPVSNHVDFSDILEGAVENGKI